MACLPVAREQSAVLDGELARMFRALQNRPVSEMLRWTIDQLDASMEDEREVRAA